MREPASSRVAVDCDTGSEGAVHGSLVAHGPRVVREGGDVRLDLQEQRGVRRHVRLDRRHGVSAQAEIESKR